MGRENTKFWSIRKSRPRFKNISNDKYFNFSLFLTSSVLFFKSVQQNIFAHKNLARISDYQSPLGYQTRTMGGGYQALKGIYLHKLHEILEKVLIFFCFWIFYFILIVLKFFIWTLLKAFKLKGLSRVS